MSYDDVAFGAPDESANPANMTDQDANDWNDGIDPRIPNDLPTPVGDEPFPTDTYQAAENYALAEPLVTDETTYAAPADATNVLILARLDSISTRLTAIESTQDALKEGTNTIGAMMNGVSEAFANIMEQIQKGGIGSLLGGMMGKKNDGA
jgi:hypothetical protein